MYRFPAIYVVDVGVFANGRTFLMYTVLMKLKLYIFFSYHL